MKNGKIIEQCESYLKGKDNAVLIYSAYVYNINIHDYVDALI